MCAVYGVQIPNNDGRAGMVTIVRRRKVDVEIDEIASQLLEQLPKYAVPVFIRLKDEIDFTHTHKIKKFNLKKEGFNCNDEVFVMLPKSKTYIQMNKDLLKEKNDQPLDLIAELKNYTYEATGMSPALPKEKVRDLSKMYDKFIDPSLRPEWLPAFQSKATSNVSITSPPSSELARQHRAALKKGKMSNKGSK